MEELQHKDNSRGRAQGASVNLLNLVTCIKVPAGELLQWEMASLYEARRK